MATDTDVIRERIALFTRVIDQTKGTHRERVIDEFATWSYSLGFRDGREQALQLALASCPKTIALAEDDHA